MEQHDIHLATACIHFSEIEYFPHRACYVFNITFVNTSSLLFNHLSSIPAGFDEYIAKDFLNDVKEYFSSVGIQEGSRVAVLFAESRILAISALGNELWIDVHEGIFPNISPKTFRNLGITMTSLTVH